ncbi:hypothetical protein SFUMM280S_00550 [Streptomyces fumanus]
MGARHVPVLRSGHRRETLTHVLAVEIQPRATGPHRADVDRRARLRGDRDPPAQAAVAAHHRTAHGVRDRPLPGGLAGRGGEADRRAHREQPRSGRRPLGRHLHRQRGQRRAHGVLRLRPGHPAARRRCPAGRQPGPRPVAGRRRPAGRRGLHRRHAHRRALRVLRRGPAGPRRPPRPDGRARAGGHRGRRPGHRRRRPRPPGRRHPGRGGAGPGRRHPPDPRPGPADRRRERPGGLLRRGRRQPHRPGRRRLHLRHGRSRT